jgi:hypothetical protein
VDVKPCPRRPVKRAHGDADPIAKEWVPEQR